MYLNFKNLISHHHFILSFILSILIVFSILIGFFSFMSIPASAETDSLIIDGSLCGKINGYNIVGVNHTNNNTLIELYKHYTNCSVFLLASYDGNYYLPTVGTSIIPQLNIHRGSTGVYVYRYGLGSEGDSDLYSVSPSSSQYDSWLSNIALDVLFSDDSSVTTCFRSSSNRSKISQLCDFNGNSITNIPLSECSYYWAVNPNFVWTSNSGKMTVSNVISGSDGSGFVSATLASSAHFININESSSDGSNFQFVDWIKAGTQYPLVDFQINDNGNLNSYALRVSVNNSYSNQIKQFHESEDVKDILYYLSHGSWISNNLGSVGQKVKLLNSLSECDTWYYDFSSQITSDLFTFDNKDVKSKIFSLNLSDYTSILAYNIYRLEIVNLSDSQVLSTSYFASFTNFDRTTSVYGIKSYEYTSSSDADADNNNESYTGNYIPGSTGSNDNISDLTFNNFSSNLSSLDITSIFSTLQTALNSVSSFFKSCYSLIPAPILSIILCGLTLTIILRVLGR